MKNDSNQSNHALTLYRWTALTSGLACLFLAPLLKSYVPDLVDPWQLRISVGAGYLMSCVLSFTSPWVKQNFQKVMLGMTYAISAWLLLLNHLNDFTPPLAYAIFELLIGGSIAFVSLRSLFVYLAAVCVTTAILVQNIVNTDLHVEMYISTLVVVAILVLLVNYWRNMLLQEAKESGLLMQSVFSNSADGLILLRAGQVVKASAQALSMLQASTFEDIEKRIANQIADRADYHNSSTDMHITHHSGLNLWVEIVVTEAGAKALELMRLTDISERKQAELELTRAATTAESALRARRDFLTTISHELRTPLNGVIGASRLLALEHTEGSDAELIRIIERSGGALLGSIDNIILYAEMDSGELALRAESLSLEYCARQAIACVRDQAEQKNLNLQVTCRGLASLARVGDPIHLMQIVELLLSNAVKFTKQGSIDINLFVRDEKKPELVTFEITDTGIGIEPELCDHIFESFTQGDSSDAREHGGIGLGLAICSRLVSRLGGRLSCHSTLGQGSTFSYTLPLPLDTEVVATTQVQSNPQLLTKLESESEPKQETQATVAPKASIEVKGDTTSCAYGSRVLLVEDNLMNQKITMKMLNKLGYQADLAEDGQEAITACQHQHYDLILMDLQMPNMGGLEATAALRAKTATQLTPIIALTANAQASDRERCLAAGMNDFLAKPAKLDSLDERLQHYLAVAH